MFCSLSSIGQLADLTEVTRQCLLWPEPQACARVRRRNARGQGKVRIASVSQLVRHCGQNLSQDEVPREIALVDALAHTPEGDVDSLALLARDSITDF